MLLPSLLPLGLTILSVFAQEPGFFLTVGDTLVSAMMVCYSCTQVSIIDGHQIFVVSPDKVYIVDKVEGNAYEINGHSLYSVVWCVTLFHVSPFKTRDRDVAKKTATPLDVQNNSFCAAGMHFPNGSYALFGGITPRLVQLLLLTQRAGTVMALEPSVCSTLVTAALCVLFMTISPSWPRNAGILLRNPWPMKLS